MTKFLRENCKVPRGPPCLVNPTLIGGYIYFFRTPNRNIAKENREGTEIFKSSDTQC